MSIYSFYLSFLFMIDTFMLMHFHQAVLFPPLSHRYNRQQVLPSIIISGVEFHVLIVIKLESQLRGSNVYLIEQHSLLEDLPANLFIASQVSVPSTPPFLSYLSVHRHADSGTLYSTATH